MNMKVIVFWDVTLFNDVLLSCSAYHVLPEVQSSPRHVLELR